MLRYVYMEKVWDFIVELLRIVVPAYLGWIFVIYGFDEPTERFFVTMLLVVLWLLLFGSKYTKNRHD